MGTIEHQLRLGISRTMAEDPEQRNRVYMAARDVIYRLPEAQHAEMIDELTQAVKKIEYEYARLELAGNGVKIPPAQAVNSEPPTVMLPDINEAAYEEREPRTGGKLLDGVHRKTGILSRLRFPALAACMGLAIGIASYLLLLQFSLLQPTDTDAISSVSPSVQSDASAQNSAPGRIKTLLNYQSRDEMALLSSSGNGRVPLTPHRLDDPQHPAISIPDKARIFSREPVRLREGQLYLMRFQLRISPSDAKVRLNAGFIGAGKAGAAKNKAFFVHQGEISPANPKAEDGLFLFSGVAEWSDIYGDLAMSGNSGLARPTIQVNAPEDVKLWLVSVSVSEL